MSEVPSTQKKPPAFVTPLEFGVITEPWHKYKLEDGTKLFAKLVVLKVMRTAEYDIMGNPGYQVASQNLLATIAPDQSRGQPSNPMPNPTDPTTYKILQTLDVSSIGEDKWNEYRVADGTVIKLKLEITNVVKTDKFAADGDPFYVVNSATIPKFKVPQSLVKALPSPKPDTKGPYA